MKLLATIALAATLLTAANCQRDPVCDDVNAGLEPILGPCRESVTDCVEAQDLARVSDLFCMPEALTQFNNFLGCTNRMFSDQIFGAICGGPSCTQGQFSACAPVPGARCFEQVSLNDGSNAFQSCMCSVRSDNDTCPGNCRSQLEQLVDDVGCCVNTALYVYFFSTCGEDILLENIEDLFTSCGVALPATCLHPFSDDDDADNSATVTRMTFAPIVVALLTLFYVLK